MSDEAPRAEIIPDGPYRVEGVPIGRIRPIRDDYERPVGWEQTEEELPLPGPLVDLCRCGLSKTKPFCDGSEKDAGFDGTETADRGPTLGRRRWFGEPPFVLGDDRSLCSSAGFCVRFDTDAWELAEQTGDPAKLVQLREIASMNCPSGRLAMHPAAGGPVEGEEPYPPRIDAVDDGPLWVRGGVQLVGADGFEYERRNRMTLCRCGHSANKPFCDGSHKKEGFRDPE